MLNDGSLIRLTVARYYTPTGRLIQKSYENGYEEYALDLINRYNNGELSSTDSIVFPESQRYTTLTLNRTVYGGGGIMPDYFVPLDTTAYSEYYRNLIGKGIFNRFVLQYVDDHRKQLQKEYHDFNTFNSGYEPSKSTLDKLVSFASDEGLEFNEADWSVSKAHITILFKSYMARDLWGMEHFFEVYNSTDEVFIKAVEILENPSLLHQKLAKVDTR
jgi:carboxyl-terminal processing protease